MKLEFGGKNINLSKALNKTFMTSTANIHHSSKNLLQSWILAKVWIQNIHHRELQQQGARSCKFPTDSLALHNFIIWKKW